MPFWALLPCLLRPFCGEGRADHVWKGHVWNWRCYFFKGEKTKEWENEKLIFNAQNSFSILLKSQFLSSILDVLSSKRLTFQVQTLGVLSSKSPTFQAQTFDVLSSKSPTFQVQMLGVLSSKSLTFQAQMLGVLSSKRLTFQAQTLVVLSSKSLTFQAQYLMFYLPKD